MAELLHAGAFAATAVSTCCVAASGRRLLVRELALALLMLVAMADVVLGWGLLAPVWWAAALVVSSMLAVFVSRSGRPLAPAARLTRAMDGMGGILMAALLVLMSGDGAAAVGAQEAHGTHGGSASALIWAVVAASVLFAAASVRMGVSMRMPSTSATPRVRVLRRVAPLAMGLSVLLMAAVVVV